MIYSHAAPRERKIPLEQLGELVELHEQGWPVGALAARYGVVPSAISYQLGKHTVLYRDRMPAERAELRTRRAAWRRQRKEMA